jgi:hypothetical protein
VHHYCAIALRTRSLTHDRLPESANRAKAYLSSSQGESGRVDALSLEHMKTSRSSSSDFLVFLLGSLLKSRISRSTIRSLLMDLEGHFFHLEIFFHDLASTD